jgi:hypothetical protein
VDEKFRVMKTFLDPRDGCLWSMGGEDYFREPRHSLKLEREVGYELDGVGRLSRSMDL